MLWDVLIKFYGRGWERLQRDKKPSDYRVKIAWSDIYCKGVPVAIRVKIALNVVKASKLVQMKLLT